MKKNLQKSFDLGISFTLTSCEMGGGGKKSSTIGFTVRPNIYKYTDSLVNAKLFCCLLKEVTL